MPQLHKKAALTPGKEVWKSPQTGPFLCLEIYWAANRPPEIIEYDANCNTQEKVM